MNATGAALAARACLQSIDDTSNQPPLAQADLTWIERVQGVTASLYSALEPEGPPNVDLVLIGLAKGLALVVAACAAEGYRIETGEAA